MEKEPNGILNLTDGVPGKRLNKVEGIESERTVFPPNADAC
jgi:hypothetical protein